MAQDTARRVAARVAETVEFATKPQLAQHMIERAIAAQVPFAWLTGDAVYGNDRRLRVWLEQQDLHFVLAVASNQHVWPDLTGQKTVAQLADTAQPQDWVRLSAGDGAKGPRLYEWLIIPLLSWQMPGERWLLRRRLTDGERAYYVGYAPPTPTCKPWSGWQARTGRWKSALRRPKAKSGWITRKCAVGTAGTDT